MAFIRHAILIFLVTAAVISSAIAETPKTTIPSNVWGKWKIVRFEEVGGHAHETEEKAKGEVEKTITFSKNQLDFESPFLFFDRNICTKPQYSIKIKPQKEYDASDKGSLDYFGLKAQQEGQSKNLIITCGGTPMYWFEFAPNNELAIYYDGWFFFLTNVK